MPAYEVVIEGRQDGDDLLNVLHYMVPDGQQPDWQAGADEIRAHLSNYLELRSNPNVRYLGITVRLDEPGQVGVFYAFTGGPVIGAADADDAVRQVAMLVRKRNLDGTRPALGWFFVGGITVGATNADGSWDSPTVTDVQNYADDIRILGAVTQTDTQMVIKARNPTAPNTVPYATVDVVEAAPTQPRTVRSRAKGVGQ